MQKIKLRRYQQEALLRVIKSFDQKVHKQLLVLPTGSGKTILFIAIAQYYNKKTLILAHRDELITQAHEKFKRFWPSADIGIYKGASNNLNHQIIISSIQTCSQPKRLVQLKKEGFSVLIIDEAHHSISKSYQLIIEALDFCNDPSRLLIGVTATPNRSDKKSLKRIFQKVTYSTSIDKLIRTNHLSPVIARRILTDLNIKGIKTYMGDFATRQLSEAVNIPQRNTFIVKKLKEHAKDRKTIAFCVDVQHCKDLAAEFNQNGIVAAAVWGNMDPKLRKKILEDFSNGSIAVLTSCSLLTEGFDEPSVSCIIMARPTKSQSLFIQMVGRGLRIDPKNDKKNCLVLDFTDKHNDLNTIISLDQVIPNAQIITDQKPKNKSQTNLATVKHKIRSDKNIDQELNLLSQPKFMWINIEHEWSLIDDHNNEIVIQQKENGFIATIFFDKGESRILVQNPTSLQQCKSYCESWAQDNLTITYADANSQWMKDAKKVKATAGQIAFLKSHKAYKGPLSKAGASIKIRHIIAELKAMKRERAKVSNMVQAFYNKYNSHATVMNNPR